MSSAQSNSDCIFCKISRGEIPAPKVYEDDTVFCIRDLHPQAKAHLLVIPKTHYRDWNDTFKEGDPTALWGKLALAVNKVSAAQGLDAGFRVVANTGAHGGQSVHHLHLHVLGGETLSPRFS